MFKTYLLTPLCSSILLYQHDLKKEAEACKLHRAKEVFQQRESAARILDEEESLRQAARREDQTVGPWGFKRVERGNIDEGTLLQATVGSPDGLGIFGTSVEDGDFHAFHGGGYKPGVDDAEMQLFQPLQHAAHEER